MVMGDFNSLPNNSAINLMAYKDDFDAKNTMHEANYNNTHKLLLQ